MAIVGHITVTREGRILVAKNGRHVEAVECTDESLRETVRTLARAHFGVGGVLRRSKQSTRDAHVYLVFR
jgi:hypothetical protein